MDSCLWCEKEKRKVAHGPFGVEFDEFIEILTHPHVDCAQIAVNKKKRRR